ncbi:MAG: endonuclease/exonuclease/phosphatase family protein [Pirellulales bacterium]|nr:endonuclease/exonuclease/phosphatase family protein [Pirellulales bacterium]
MSDEPLVVKAMAFNIRLSRANDGPDQWDNRKQLVAEIIRRFGGDVIGVQEAWPEQIAYFQSQFSDYGILSRTRDDNPEWGEAVPVLWQAKRWQPDPDEQGTFWLSDTPGVPGSKTFGNALPRIVTWVRLIRSGTGHGVYVYNTHFSHISEWARRQSAAMLVHRIAHRRYPDPVIVLGDFNAGEPSETMQCLKGEVPGAPFRLVDTFRAMHPHAQLVGTYHYFQGSRTGDKVDYVLTTPDATVLEAQILYDQEDGRYPSDHYPVTAIVRFPAATGSG